MNLLFSGLIIIVLIAIAYEDFKYRAVHIGWLSALILLSVCYTRYNFLETWLNNTIANGLYIGLQIACLTLYFSIRNKQFINIFKTYLGIGDLVFMIAVCPLFNLNIFLYIFIFSLVIILLISLLWNKLRPNPNFTIPLAGCWAMQLIPYFLYQIYNSH